VLEVAHGLLGLLVVRRTPEGVCAGRIVEVEAYGGAEDRASHARAGRTERTAPMFGPPGHAYVYLVYGLHHCLNVVAESDGAAGAVLVRALEPVAGIGLMRARRTSDRPRGPALPTARLAAGPARLCQALAIDRRLDGVDLLADDRLWLATDGPLPLRPVPRDAVAVGPRVGVAYAGEWAARPWRLGLRGHPSLSRPFPAGA
jgi:DNA-3-methyladenine glycosylase